MIGDTRRCDTCRTSTQLSRTHGHTFAPPAAISGRVAGHFGADGTLETGQPHDEWHQHRGEAPAQVLRVHGLAAFSSSSRTAVTRFLSSPTTCTFDVQS